MSKWEKIGEFCVDSGTFMICDPCYVQDPNWVEKIDQAGRQMFENDDENGCVTFENDSIGLAVIGNTIIGDGQFSVYQRINPKGEKEVKITFK